MLSKKNVTVHLISLCVLCFGFILCRYVFFGVHGMKQWPALLFVIGVNALAISFFAKAKTTPIIASLSYTVGFLVGVVLQTDGVDAGGGRINNLWIIWTVVYLCAVAIAIVSDVVILVRKKSSK